MKYIFSFGCPRSGTTFIQKNILLKLKGVYYRKIPEWHGIHPCQSSDGLLSLNLLLDNILFIRTIRNPIDILESFYMFRQPKYKDHVFSKWIDWEILNFIINEELNTRRQINHEHWRSKIIKISYDRMKDKDYILPIIDNILKHIDNKDSEDFNRDILISGFESFGKEPARIGRLSEDFKKKLLTYKERVRFKKILERILR